MHKPVIAADEDTRAPLWMPPYNRAGAIFPAGIADDR